MTGISPTRVIGGRYVVLDELGRGSSAVVWRAEDRVTGRQVAVKELQLAGRRSPEERLSLRERLLQAARATGRIDYPGIVTVHDVVSDHDVEHIVMELVEAPTLADTVAAGGPLSDDRATALARALAAALCAIHAAGLVHGDVKPSNVLLGPGDRVRLTDLGVAEAADALSLAAPTSPAYLAPERLDGDPGSPESDLWALGATLFFALHGQAPFAGETGHTDVSRTSTGGALGAVLTGLLQRAPQARLTAPQVVAQLDVSGGPVPSAGRSGYLPGRRWIWALVAAVLGAAGGFALAGTGDPDVTTLYHGPGGDVSIFATIDDTCLRDGLESGLIDDHDRLSCDDPHALEVFETLDPYGQRDVPYPRAEAVERFAAQACTAVFDAVVTGPDVGGLEIVALVPSREGFETRGFPANRFGGRDVHCLLRAADGRPLIGTRIAGKPG
jgi:tRNA A-37 threonylcarbamoyl transferase component Bud32